jgi:hypothetical protein
MLRSYLDVDSSTLPLEQDLYLFITRYRKILLLFSERRKNML